MLPPLTPLVRVAAEPLAPQAFPDLDKETVAEAVERLKQELGCSSRVVPVCIFVGAGSEGAASEELVRVTAERLTACTSRQAVFITGGMPGAQKMFSENFGDASRLWNLLPLGQRSSSDGGRGIHAGANLEQCIEIFAQLGDIYIMFAGAPAISEQARAACLRGAAVVPLERSGASLVSGRCSFPDQALRRPAFASEEQWALLNREEVPVADIAAAVVGIINRFLMTCDDAVMLRDQGAVAATGSEMGVNGETSVTSQGAASAEARLPVADEDAESVKRRLREMLEHWNPSAPDGLAVGKA